MESHEFPLPRIVFKGKIELLKVEYTIISFYHLNDKLL
ncbi:hypothetical protein ADIARSV_2950 [Arcticibacter svalbardensis MN12-7]|uniref:Uncharacterized protein n=1 Tax=Arcticibacter svalbardensis MN12-7 TaxID=1150600 RepID=R9GPW2_9SPHI|nr:hypothetical protein ADIARSV_2950 [Arcticibacter svalbardensis MN12-7]